MTKQAAPLTPIMALPGPPLYQQFQITFAQTNVPQQIPAFRVRPGASVTLFPTTPTGVNAHPCFVGDQPDLLGTTGSRTLPAGPMFPLRCSSTTSAISGQWAPRMMAFW